MNCSQTSLQTNTLNELWIKKPMKPTVPYTLASIPSSKPMSTSIVDLILLEESSRAKQSKTGAVIKLKNCNKNLSAEV